MKAKQIRAVAVRAVAMFLFFSMILAVILYEAGVYDLSFIDRPLPPVTTTTEPPVSTDVPDASTEVTTTFGTETAVPPPTIEITPEEFLAAIPTLSALAEEGYELADLIYTPDKRFVKLELTFDTDVFSLRTHTVKKKILVQNSNGTYSVKTSAYLEALPTIRLYGGMILVDNGSSYAIYNSQGKLIVRKFTGMLTMARSFDGIPVVTINGRYYELDPEKGISKELTAEEVDFKAIRFDAPVYYAWTGAAELTPFSAEVDVLVELGEDLNAISVELKGNPAAASEEDEASEVSTTEPTATEPVTTEPVTTEPVTTEPLPTEPTTTEPTTSETVTTEPTASESVTTELLPTEPPVTEPNTPESTTNPPTTTEPPSTSEPTTTEPTTTEPTVTKPNVTKPSTTEPSATKPSTTEPSTTKPTTTEPSTTEPSTSEPATSDPATTDLPEGVVYIDGVYYQVTKGIRWGYRDLMGNVVIEPQYVTACAFTSQGLAAVTDEEGNLFFIDTEGNETVSLRDDVYVTPPEFSYIRSRQLFQTALEDDIDSIGMYYYDSGYVMVRYCLRGTSSERLYWNENRLVDAEGNYFDLPADYTLEGYSDGILLLKKDDGRYGYMNNRGEWVAPAVYRDASPFLYHLAVVVDEDGNYGMIDAEGNVVLPCVFDYVSDASGGVVAAYRAESGWEFYGIAALS